MIARISRTGVTSLTRLMFASGMLVLGSIASAEAQQAGPPAAQLTVSAEGRVAAAPDMATVTLGVRRDAKTATEAVAGMSSAAASILSALSEAGIEARDTQTSGLSLSPQYNRPDPSRTGPPEVVGYSAETTIFIRVRVLDDLGAILDRVVSEGSNLLRGLSFGVADPVPLQDEARRRAVQEAARQAALLAEAAGVTLGPLVRLDVSGRGGRPEMMRMAQMDMASEAGIPIAQGEVSFTADVSLVYAIEQ